ncbi:Methionine ABC transporter ATP-binding protein [Cystobacter fuscus DSM 2262]|uniref:Cell division ATP-binding protein FtsE n=1 Tax=Cystobacter fuscus (strain ATCC 25194 / DSM 2262 / NBRC 100088 / M29) TaxID=1242864 RepID=S9P056_CYSF2|nr:methionine ABC transporter ATP-binding protein [Cystobacter fuscus]EPX55617.1 Methionine ABC transporter ATP-binding protein [Cystobacter fuscus DSM 2262]
MIELREVSKVYRQEGREVAALQGVSLRVAPGEVFGVLGQSGAGKSTLIRCVNLLERPTSGEVRVEGRDMLALEPHELRQARQGIGMIFQHFNLFSSQTVAGNVAYPLEVAGWPRPRIQERVAELLQLVGLSDRAHAYPAQLSGGQKQRVGIARALAPRPKILLSDEATSALDPETTRSVLGLLRDINRQLGLTILLITHQMDVVKDICDSVAVLERGRLVEQGKVIDLVTRPGSRLHELFYAPFASRDWPVHPGRRLVELTFVGEKASQPVLTTMARRFEVDANLMEGSLDRVAGAPVGRLLFELTGEPEAVKQAMAFLREQGLTLEERAHV